MSTISMSTIMEFPKAKTIIEPFRIKTVEPIPFLETARRTELLAQHEFNLFKLPANAVTFDLLTDSGTSAMSAQQWAAMMTGDESYAGSASYYRLQQVIQNLTGMQYVVPTHQGRSAEALLMRALVKPGQTVVGNTHFDTTRANIEAQGAQALDLPAMHDAFKGNIDLAALQQQLAEQQHNIPLVILTVTNNAVGGQPVSMQNIKDVNQLLEPLGIPLYLDAARFAENAFFIKQREPGYADRSIREIANEMFCYADGVLMSAKKDAFANIGGFLALRDAALEEQVRALMVLTEGFPTYGGLAGRDLDVLAVGLEEILDEHYLQYRIRSVAYFGEGIEAAGYHVIKPFGGHAVYIDAAKSLPHLSALQFPGQSLSVALYQHIGIRSVEVGSVMLGKRNPRSGEHQTAPFELLRLAMPRRVYTQSHADYMIEMMGYLTPYLSDLPGYEFTYEPEALRHFNARFKPITTSVSG